MFIYKYINIYVHAMHVRTYEICSVTEDERVDGSYYQVIYSIYLDIVLIFILCHREQFSRGRPISIESEENEAKVIREIKKGENTRARS